jgi:hypothetical protein
MSKILNIPIGRIREALDYDPVTGIFTRTVGISNVKAGDVSGYKTREGYRVIMIDGVLYLAHRLAWAHYYGVQPPDLLDHIHGAEAGDMIANLRESTRRKNGQNRATHRNGRLVGACFHKSNRKWAARIEINGKRKHLGYHATEREAHEAYLIAVKGLP